MEENLESKTFSEAFKKGWNREKGHTISFAKGLGKTLLDGAGFAGLHALVVGGMYYFDPETANKVVSGEITNGGLATTCAIVSTYSFLIYGCVKECAKHIYRSSKGN